MQTTLLYFKIVKVAKKKNKQKKNTLVNLSTHCFKNLSEIKYFLETEGFAELNFNLKISQKALNTEVGVFTTLDRLGNCFFSVRHGCNNYLKLNLFNICVFTHTTT